LNLQDQPLRFRLKFNFLGWIIIFFQIRSQLLFKKIGVRLIVTTELVYQCTEAELSPALMQSEEPLTMLPPLGTPLLAISELELLPNSAFGCSAPR
jgi:hypothetical protein